MKGSVFAFLLPLLLSYRCEGRLFAFVANTTHIVTFDSSPTGFLTYLHAHPNVADGAWVSTFPSINPYLLLATTDLEDGNGAITLYEINRDNNSSRGSLIHRNVTNSTGVGPAYVTFDQRGNYALVANYGNDDGTGQSVAVFPVNHSTLSFGNYTAKSMHTGNSTNPDRQGAPHPHMFVTDPFSNSFAFSPDLGTDQVYQYQFNATNGALVPNRAMPYATPDTLGDGPRHIAFHPDRLFAYLVNEMGNSVDVFSYDYKLGQLTDLVQTVSTLPDDFTGESNAAEVLVTPDGRFLYASNRGYDSIVGFYIDPTSTDFHLKRVSFTTERISTPRGFAIDPYGKFLIVGSSSTGEIVTFNIRTDGILVWNAAITKMNGAISIQLNEYD